MNQKKNTRQQAEPAGEISDEVAQAPDAQIDGQADEARVSEETAEAKPSDDQLAASLRELPDDKLLAVAREAEKADHWHKFAQRSQAELENTIKRLTRENAEHIRYALEPMARSLLDLVDNLERALAASKETGDFDGLYEGISLTHKMFLQVLENFGVKPIEALGQPFDPARHEAMMTGADESKDPNVILQELARGWTIHDRVLRASKVSVNKTGGSKD